MFHQSFQRRCLLTLWSRVVVTAFSKSSSITFPKNYPIHCYPGGLRIPVVLVLGRPKVGPSFTIRCRFGDYRCAHWQDRFSASRETKEGEGFDLMLVTPLHTSYQSIDDSFQTDEQCSATAYYVFQRLWRSYRPNRLRGFSTAPRRTSVINLVRRSPSTGPGLICATGMSRWAGKGTVDVGTEVPSL